MRLGAGPVGRVRGAAATPWVRTVAVLVVAQIVSEIAFSFALPFTPLFVQELGVEGATEAGLWAGLSAGMSSILMGVMGPLWGVAADRYGHRLMIQRAMFGAGLAVAAMALVQSPEQLLVLRLLHGALTGVVPAIATLASLTAPTKHLATVLGLLQAAMFLGISLGPLFGGAFADIFGLRAGFAVGGATLLALGLVVTLTVPNPRQHQQRSSTGEARQERGRLVSGQLLAIVGLMGVARFVHLAPQPVLPLFVQDLVGPTDRLGTIVGLVLAGSGIAASIGALLLGPVADRLGWRPVLLACLACGALLSPTHLLIGSVWHLVALRIALGFAVGGMFPAIQSLLVRVTPPGRRGAAFGLLATAHAIGNGGGPIVGSILAAMVGVPIMLALMTPILTAAGSLVARLRVAAGSRGEGDEAGEEAAGAPRGSAPA